MKLQEIVADTIARQPDRTAAVHQNRRWTYEQLGREAADFAGRLRGAGFEPGDRAVLWMENSPDYIAAYLAILSAGGVVVPAHAKSLAEEVLRTVRHVGAAGIVTTPALWENNGVCFLDSGLRFGMTPKETFAVRGGMAQEKAAEGLAQIIYTSGTTGQPKGVMLSHDNLIANTRGILSCLSLTEKDGIVAILPFVFVYGNSVMLTHLFAGAKIVTDVNLAYPNVVVDLMEKEQVTGFSGVASNYAFLLRMAHCTAEYVPSMRYFTSAGGPMPSELLRKIQAAFPGRDFHVMYGQTEATARISMLPPSELARKYGSAGRAVPGATIRIRREDGSAAAFGETGEITVSGNNVMLGYWKDPAGTAAVLRDGALHTGDLGRMDEEGFIYITGRSSEMIKSGAYRVSPNEIEEVLFRHPDVFEAGVVGVEDDLLGEVIVALVVPKAGKQPRPNELLAHCAQHLASFKRPKDIFLTAELPRSTNGKILRQPLRGLARSLASSARAQGGNGRTHD